MAKVFRLHTGAADTLSNWDDSVKIGSTAIDRIPDPIGATDAHEITSIPSPFARMDLVKNAFKIVSDGQLEGSTIYHKLVSDTLDVGQIFFNIEKYRDSIEIIVWDKQNALKELGSSIFDEHQRLGRTYGTYLQQDQDVYHFDQMDCIYLLNYKAPTAPHEMNIIGATSPATLFFTSANDLSYVGQGEYAITFGNDRPFDGAYSPLYKRDESYIKYLWSLKKSRQDFPALFPEVNSYLEKCFNYFSPSLKKDLQALSNTAYQKDYDDISVNPIAQNYVTILGQRLKGKKSVNEVHSDFEMAISPALRKAGEKIPLVLPVETFTEPLTYVIDVWNKNTHVPYFDNRAIAERSLPEDGTSYPYVTISDFLEDSIVSIPYKFNRNAFFNGNDEKPEENNSYLLPIKKTFFNYFQASDLIGKIDNKNMIEIIRLVGDGVKVILRIPVKGGHIKYERIYYKADKADIANNKGVIINRELTLGQFPAIKYSQDVTPYYRITILDRDALGVNQNNHYKLSFFDNKNEAVECDSVVERNRNSDGGRFSDFFIDSATYVMSKEYQYIQVSDRESNGFDSVVIPHFAARTGNHKFRFAIDFGTTNTHIEYSVDGETPRAFKIEEGDMQMQKLHSKIDDGAIIDVFRSDFVASAIGGDSIYSYPMRTVLSETNNTNWSKPVYSMAHANVPFAYEKSKSLPYNVLHTDLKWSPKQDDKQRAAMYIECLMIMLRNKVLLNNGDLAKTEIVWFYPASMTQSRFNKFRDEWEKCFIKYFNAPVSNIIAISESAAPFYFYKNKMGTTATVASIDIGGGTTDVLIADKGEPKYLTSFRFAANSIFGDGYSYESSSNGIVQKYTREIKDLLEQNKLNQLTSILRELEDKKVSADIISFFFSLAGNKETQGVIDFGKMLADDNKSKYIMILFYVSIMYYIANIMKAKDFPMPRHITFSGNGSKMLNILTTSNSTLENFTKLIFEKVYGQSYSIDGLTIIRPEHSKESTCKGGIIHEPFQPQDYFQIKDMKTILLGTDNETFSTEKMSYDDIDESLKDKVVANVNRFFDFAFSLDKAFSFYDAFDVDKSIIESVKSLCARDVRTYLENGISIKTQMLEQDGADNNVEETLFFYPLVGVLNALVREIYNM